MTLLGFFEPSYLGVDVMGDFMAPIRSGVPPYSIDSPLRLLIASHLHNSHPHNLAGTLHFATSAYLRSSETSVHGRAQEVDSASAP